MTNETLSVEEVENHFERVKWLHSEVHSLKKLCDKSVVSICVLLVLSIFFLPCLILAGIAFALRCWGVNRIATYKAEMDKLALIPEVMERSKVYAETGA